MLNAKDVIKIELSCFGSNNKFNISDMLTDENVSESTQHILCLLMSRRYHECLNEGIKSINIFELISSLGTSQTINATKLLTDIKDHTERKLVLYACAVCCIQLFVQINWTGPFVEVVSGKNDETIKAKARDLLNLDTHTIYHLVKASHYLYSALVIFFSFREDALFQTVPWWLFRCYCVYRQLMSERSEELFRQTEEIMKIALSQNILQQDDCKSYLFQLHIEAGLSLLYYYQYQQADEQFEAAKKLTGIEFGFTGALGVRTKFQQKPVSQLQMLVKRSGDVMKSSVPKTATEIFPINMLLNDDTVLNKVKLVDELETPDLTAEEYCMILAACTAMQKTNPAHRLQQEKVQTIIEFLLNAPSCWCVHAEALRIRCLNEKEKSRTVERSMMQLESLVSAVSEKDSNSYSRCDLFYAIQPPPIWKLQKDLANLFISLGATSSALQIYERLEIWEDAILCLIRTQRNSQAMEMIQTQLRIRETPNLWCLLGDILQKPEHYEKAWELSKHRSTRAMTSLGYYYVSKKNFSQAVECFERSLSVLSLQVNTLFTMGCVLFNTEEFLKAANAFRRCVSLDWDNYEAWTNLSSAYVKCGKKDQAFKALSEAIKCNFDKWQLWENYIAIATDLGQFTEAISAYDRLLELKTKYVDIPVLTVLVRAATENIEDAFGQSGSHLTGRLKKLFGHLTSRTSNHHEIWSLYARLCGDGVTDDDEENDKAIQHLHKALRTGLQKSGWEKDNDSIENLIKIAKRIAAACEHCQTTLPKQALSPIRLSMNGFLGKLKQRSKSIIDLEASTKHQEYINQVEEFYQTIKQITERI